MTKLHITGPRTPTSGPVSFQKVFTRSPDRNESKFLVTLKLGDALRRSATPEDTSQAHLLEQSRIVHSKELGGSSSSQDQAFAGLDKAGDDVDTDREDTPLKVSESVKTPPVLSVQKQNTSTDSLHTPTRENNHTLQTAADPAPETPSNQSHSDSESEIEILEVRAIDVPSLSTDHTYNSTDEDTDKDLSDLDDEINEALTSNTVTPSSLSPKKTIDARTSKMVQKLLPNLCRKVEPRSPPPPGFRNIPPNLVNAIQRELNFFFDGGGDDDVEVVGKMVFSLQDPIARTKINLPIKATTCRHFECFDFDNFCLFYGLSPGTKTGLFCNLLVQSKESRQTEHLFYKQQRIIAEGKFRIKRSELVYPQFSEHGQMFFTDVFSRTPPLYKCPVCDEKFGLKQLYISDVFNFLVKTTPSHITKIELVENDRYKIIEEDNTEPTEEHADVVDLDDDDDQPLASLKAEKGLSCQGADRSMTSDEFNDGLDDVLIGLSQGQGDGSWLNPLTLD
ncbi:hypothetical protein PUMCH_002123 [Australozyma saopauloensis]|uniref:SP-RING-type domain-containing protein n=1 Tax=Australozyma saopauloensis TaxID=291208 RepID=A0AAX4H996_9ASCO|nr:hypothetical protein PUMCH_002123 [[Candida] saopauloensis]